MSETAQTIFLDTSLQTERILAEPKAFEAVEAQLGRPHIEAITTSYVWMEFQCTIVDDYAHIHRIMHKHQGWSATITHLLDGSRSFRPRAAVRCTKIIGRLYRQSYQDWTFARELLGEQIERQLKDHFWHHVTPLPDSIGCDLVRNGVTIQPDDTYTVAATCRKEHAACHLPAFLSEKQAELRAIADYLAAHPNVIKGQGRVAQLLTAILSDQRAA